MTSYATLRGCREAQRVANGQVAEDAKLAELIEIASARIDRYTGEWFNETVATFSFTVRLGARDLDLYATGRPLLAITALTNGDGAAIPSDEYTLLPTHGYPKRRLELTERYFWSQPAGALVYEDPDLIHVRASAFTVSERGAHYLGYGRAAYLPDRVSIAGMWGHHRDYTRAWESTTLTGTVANATSTTLTLSAAAGTQIDVGSVIRLGTEYMLVTGPVANFGSQTAITVRRGYNGSTPSDHAAAPVWAWRMEPPVELACQMLVAAYYAARNNPAGDRLVVPDLGAVQVPSRMPDKVRDLLAAYVNPFTGGV